MMCNQEFWQAYRAKKFSQAASEFESLTAQEKESTLATLFQHSQHHTMPYMISVLQRHLHSGKEFDDFHQAWLPPTEYCKPVTEGDIHYPQYFAAPTRVINAVCMHNPNEIISVGLTWIHTPEQAQAMTAFGRGETIPGSQERSERVGQVAEKIGQTKICIVKSDDNIGVPF